MNRHNVCQFETESATVCESIVNSAPATWCCGRAARWCNAVARVNRDPRLVSAHVGKLITVTGFIGGRRCERPMLVDSGSTCSFVDAALVETHHLATMKLTAPMTVRMANGATLCCTRVVCDVDVRLPGYHGKHDLVVMPDIDAFDVVLGRPFLQVANAIVNHSTCEVIWGRSEEIAQKSNLKMTAELDEKSAAQCVGVTAPKCGLEMKSELGEGHVAQSVNLPTQKIEKSERRMERDLDKRKVTQSVNRQAHKSEPKKRDEEKVTHSENMTARTNEFKMKSELGGASAALSVGVTAPKTAHIVQRELDEKSAAQSVAMTTQKSVLKLKRELDDTNGAVCAGDQSLTTENEQQASSTTAGEEKVLNQLLQRVAEYESRMAPKQGKLPPSRGAFDHRIDLKDPTTSPVKGRAIPLSPAERDQLAIDLRELEDAGLIVPSVSEWASPVFYVPKDGGTSKRLVCDYRALNRLIKRNNTSLPHISELLARLTKAKWFTKIDLKSSYHQVLVRPEDREKTAFITPLGHFEWTVLPFGEANAPASFIRMMKQLVLKDMTERGVLDFVDDILIYSESEEQHIKDVSDVLDRLEQHELFIKPSKCCWMKREVDFLGFNVRVGANGAEITAMKSKVEAVQEWPLPRTMTQLRSFIGFANTFRMFVKGFSDTATPLFRLMKASARRKSTPLEWSEVTVQAFDDLKTAIADSAVLMVIDETKPFVLHTDASDFAVGAVLAQHDSDGVLRPVGFVSEKLSDREYRWSTYEKELYAVIVALRHWSMYLMHARNPVQVINDHASLRFLLEQPRLSAKQTRWFAFLSNFPELVFTHVPGRLNVQADALSRRADHDVGTEERQRIRSDLAKAQFTSVFGGGGLSDARVNAMSVEVSAGNVEIAEAIVHAYGEDPLCRDIMAEPSRYGYVVRWDLLERTSDGSVLVPNCPKLRSRILHVVHDSPTSGHLGIHKTAARLAANYHWSNQWADVVQYCRTCVDCQRSKARQGATPGLLQPTQIDPKGHTVALDFLGPFTRTARGNDCVLVLMDTFTRRVFLEPLSSDATAERVARIVFNRIVRHQGVPRAIRSDRDSRFTGQLWEQLWKLLGSELRITTSYHHESNGLVEKMNDTLQNSLRIYVNERASDWDTKLAACEIAFNSAVHSSTGVSPFLLDIGIEPRLPLSLTRRESHVRGSAEDLLEEMQVREIAVFHRILEAQGRQKRQADKLRRDEMYQVGDYALVDSSDLLYHRQPGSKKLRAKWLGPYRVNQVIGKLKVKLDTPQHWDTHDVWHISRLKRAHQRDYGKFPDVKDGAAISSTAITTDDTDLANYSERGAAMQQVEHEEREQAPPLSKRTRRQVQALHDRGDRYDYVELRVAHVLNSDSE